MVFRRMKPEDLEEVLQIEMENFSMPWTKQDFLSSMEKSGNLYLAAEENREIIGYCGVWVVAGEGQINNIAVRKDKWNQGAGTGLLRFLFNEGEREGVGEFTLEVRKSNERAIALYQKMGFKAMGIRPGFYEKPREDAVIMTVITSRNEGR